jgi:hypothetical protein
MVAKCRKCRASRRDLEGKLSLNNLHFWCFNYGEIAAAICNLKCMMQ